MFKRFVIMALILAVVLGGLFYFKVQQMDALQAALSVPQPPATVASATVERDAWRSTLSSVGSLVAVRGIEVSAEVAGIVREVTFESGQEVKRGDVLLRLESGVEEAALEALIAERELARLNYERRKELLPTNAVSQANFDEAAAAYQVAKAKVAEQRAVLEQKTVRAPFDGLLGIRKVDPGEYLTSGQGIVGLQALRPIYVDYALPERHYENVHVGQAVEITVNALPGRTFSGRVTAIESAISTGTRTMQVRAELPNEDGRLRPGMFARVTTIQDDARPVLTIPQTAVSYNTYGDYVYVLTETGEGGLTAERRQIDTGAVRGGRVEVLAGLEAGERVVRAGHNKLRPGQPVNIDNSVALNDAEVTAR